MWAFVLSALELLQDFTYGKTYESICSAIMIRPDANTLEVHVALKTDSSQYVRKSYV